MYKLMKHQEVTAELIKSSPCVFSMDDAGTGKTLAHLHSWAERRRHGGGRMLVFAPKSCVEAVWCNEVEKFFGLEFNASASLAPKWQPAFFPTYDVVVTNHDGVKRIMKLPPKELDKLLDGFDTLIWDESDSLRHNSQRTKAALKLASRSQWKHKACLSATPFNKSITEVFFQAMFLDGGQRLGRSFYKFRSVVCDPIQRGPQANHIEWVDKPDATSAVAGLLQDISTRHKLTDVVEMPDIRHRVIKVSMKPKLMRAYEKLKREAIIQLKSDEAVAVNAAVLANKLLQISSGSLYGEKSGHVLDTTKYELAIELAHESRPTVIFFQYDHQLKALIKEAEKKSMIYGYIDGTINSQKRGNLVKVFQSGAMHVLFLQMQSAAHGITLTESNRAVFVTPPYSASLYTQAFGRIYRKGQKRKCESILLASKGTLEEGVVKILAERKNKQMDLLDLLS